MFSRSSSSFFHLSGWKEAFEKAFGFKTFYLQAAEDGRLVGILPLVLVNTIFGRNLFSIPIGVYAGILADRDDIREHLLSEAIRLTKDLGCGYLELRYLTREGNNGHKDLILKERYATFMKELPKDPALCLQELPRKARAEARYGIKGGLTYELGQHLLDECYRLYAMNQRNLGSPVVSFRWFKVLSEIFKDQMTILSIRKDGKTIASVLTFFFKDTVLPFYGSSLPGYEKYSPNNFMYLKLQEYGVEKGYKFFDFGRSRIGAGSYHFKVHQGFEPAPLHYYYYLNKAKTVPEINPSNKFFELPKKVWQKAPLFVTNRIGPFLFKYVLP
jgi:FemAB-related protein (PEP-CTERM system-associated)